MAAAVRAPRSHVVSCSSPSSPRTSGAGQPVGVVDEVEGEAALDAEVALVRDVARVGGDLDDPLRLGIDVQVDLAADAAERARRLRLAQPGLVPGRGALDELLVDRAGRADREAAAAELALGVEPASAPTSERRAPPARAPRARAPSTASPPACSGRSARRGCRRPGRSPSAGRGPRTGSRFASGRTSGASTPRSSARSSSSFGLPAGLPFRCSLSSISVSVRWSCGTDEFVEIAIPSATRVAQAGSGRGRSLDADHAHPAAAVRVELLVVAEGRDEDAVARERVHEQLSLGRGDLAAVERERDYGARHLVLNRATSRRAQRHAATGGTRRAIRSVDPDHPPTAPLRAAARRTSRGPRTRSRTSASGSCRQILAIRIGLRG